MLKTIRRAVLTLVASLPLVAAAEKADLVVVKKSESRLYLEREGKAFASFRVSLGSKPKGQKRQEGDERTPEGRYVLDSKNERQQVSRGDSHFLPERG